MKQPFCNALLCLSLFATSCNESQQEGDRTEPQVCYNPNAIVNDTTRQSIKSAVSGQIGRASVNIHYHSPKVRERIIWGGLVPFDDVWVTGAHDATTVEISQNFEINGVQIHPGKYALFTIPGKETWIVILNKKWEQHLANEYDQEDDLVRVQVSPQTNAHTERLQYFVEDVGNNEGFISVAWEKIKIRLPLKIIR
ncbi:MAG TPA: DUF2911 domain-containing protein [Saprospiraceae bacterium]|nr:DUF2911 domain-containing protein [Saprospiraceae bacterium]